MTVKEARAKEVVDYMESCKNELAELTNDISETDKASIYVGGLSHKGMHDIESTASKSPLLTAINAKNVADELASSGSAMIDKEKLLEWDSDILIIDENRLGIVKEDYNKTPAFYKSLTAVKNGRVYGQLPYLAYYDNIETAIADIYYVGKVLCPEQFKNIDRAKKADEIYSFLLG
ncbi:MAG: ABC transporter substrate-binding protein [Clostridia bacterium]|nr:ABC transporter substrate-binding protein [Clostridia bacterium]